MRVREVRNARQDRWGTSEHKSWPCSRLVGWTDEQGGEGGRERKKKENPPPLFRRAQCSRPFWLGVCNTHTALSVCVARSHWRSPTLDTLPFCRHTSTYMLAFGVWVCVREPKLSVSFFFLSLLVVDRLHTIFKGEPPQGHLSVPFVTSNGSNWQTGDDPDLFDANFLCELYSPDFILLKKWIV